MRSRLPLKPTPVMLPGLVVADLPARVGIAHPTCLEFVTVSPQIELGLTLEQLFDWLKVQKQWAVNTSQLKI